MTLLCYAMLCRLRHDEERHAAARPAQRHRLRDLVRRGEVPGGLQTRRERLERCGSLRWSTAVLFYGAARHDAHICSAHPSLRKATLCGDVWARHDAEAVRHREAEVDVVRQPPVTDTVVTSAMQRYDTGQSTGLVRVT